MRFDSAGPRTWLLAAIAGWALLALLLALFGMGGTISPLPNDSTLVHPLQALPRAVSERLGPLTQYGEIVARPLFADDRRPHAFSLQPQGDEKAKAFDYVLTSVLITPNFKMAIIQPPDNSSPPLRFKLGEANESLPAWHLQSLDARSAVFVGPEGERRLDLRVFNGVGGEAPTVSTAPKPEQRPQGETAVAPPPPSPAPGAASVATPPPQPNAQASNATPSSPALTEQAQMEAIRKRIEARRAQLRQEALLQQQQQKQTSPVK